MNSELITEVPQSFIEEFRDHIMGTLPDEKVQCELRQVRNARIMKQAGSVNIPGLGQKVAEIDPRLFFRMQAAFGDPKNPGQTEWLKDFLADNPQLCAPGYKPKRKDDLRHGKTFIGGKPA